VVKIKVPERITKKELINWLWRVTAFAIKEDIDRYVHDLNKQTFNVPITTITVRHMKSQWGSCSSFGKITLNTALLFLPQEVFDYVIIHELAHRLHRNHSQRFWNAVESVCPNYEELRKQMRKYRISA
jgi:predicted metal-dependent hydrolase